MRPPAWLVVIDMQFGFADAGRSPWALAGFDAIVPRVNELIDQYAERVVFTRWVPQADAAGSWHDYFEAWPFAIDPASAELWDLVPQVVREGAPVVSRPTFGKWGPELLAATGGSTNLVLCGVSTDCCVLSTALAAADDGAWVQVVPDACAALSPQDHRRSLDAMAFYAPQITLVS